MKKAILLFVVFCVMLPSLLAQEETVTIRISIIDGPDATLVLMKDPIYTDSTSLPDNFFDKPLEPTYSYIGEGWSGFVYVYELEVPREFNFFVFKVDYTVPEQTIIGCLGTGHSSNIKVKAFENTAGIINSLEMYQQAMELQHIGKNHEAHKLLEKAAECGNVKAMTQLWKNYEKGIGCVKSQKKCRYWFALALDFGY